MNVAFRVDASLEIGTGHLMRCLALAETLRGRGVGIQFICRQQPGFLLPLLHQAAMPVAMLAAVPATPHASQSSRGVTQTEDAIQTIAALNGAKPDCIVMDHYGLGAQWQRQLRPHSSRLLVIDDLVDRPQDCDILLDPNFSLAGKDRYAGLVPPGASLLSGPRYALLRPEYAAHRGTTRSRAGEVTRVFVFFGGSDLQDMTGLTVEALSRVALRHLGVDVVVGANYAHRNKLERLIGQRPGATVHPPRAHLADLMAGADLAIGAGGVTTWERMCLGLPALVVTVAENQRPASEALHRRELSAWSAMRTVSASPTLSRRSWMHRASRAFATAVEPGRGDGGWIGGAASGRVPRSDLTGRTEAASRERRRYGPVFRLGQRP